MIEEAGKARSAVADRGGGIGASDGRARARVGPSEGNAEHRDPRLEAIEVGLDGRTEESHVGAVRSHGGSLSAGGGALATAADQRDVADVDLEPIVRTQGVRHGIAAFSVDLPAPPALGAVQVSVLVERPDVELLVAIGSMAVAEQPKLLEDIKRPIHGRGDRLRVASPTAFEQLRAGDVAVGACQHLDHGSALRRPAQAPSSQSFTDGIPRCGE